MKIHELKNFLLHATEEGYSAGDEKKWIKEKDGSTTITHQDGLWRSHDNFFGGEPFSGRQIVFYNDKAVWIMVYYGLINPEYKDVNEVYKVLRNALSKSPEEMPLRGPREFTEEDFMYKNNWQGNLEKYSGKEVISKNSQEIFSTDYMGGLVDMREGI